MLIKMPKPTKFDIAVHILITILITCITDIFIGLFYLVGGYIFSYIFSGSLAIIYDIISKFKNNK